MKSLHARLGYAARLTIIGSLQNLDSAAAAGDDYATVPSLLANGVGTDTTPKTDTPSAGSVKRGQLPDDDGLLLVDDLEAGCARL